MNDLTVTLVQADLYWQHAVANRAVFDRCLQQISVPTDVIVLPEMFTTGFSMDAASLAEPMDGPTLEWMRSVAAQHNAVLTGSIIIGTEDGKFYNRLLWVRPDGTVTCYDKRHLFTLAGEHEVYTPGHNRLVEEWRGWRICPLICYDLRFPAWARNSATEPYDLLLYVANWPAARQMAWKSLLRARAIENVAYTVGVNRIGRDGLGHDYAGDSALVDMHGDYLVQSGNQQGCITRTLQRAPLDDFRSRFPFLNDADEFYLDGLRATSPPKRLDSSELVLAAKPTVLS